MTPVQEFFLWLSWATLSAADKSIKNPIHDILFPSEEELTKLMLVMTFTPGLVELLQGNVAPSIAFFQSLPAPGKGTWNVYLLLLEKAGFRSKIYIGSGTDSKRGMHARTNTYMNQTHLPRLVKKAIDDGFTISHIGVLCSAPIPLAGNRFPLRAFFLLLETMFSLALWAMESRTKTYYMPELCPWKIDAVDYDGCCTHSAIGEMIVGEEEGLNTEQVAAKENEADARRKVQENRSREKYYAKRKAQDFEGWRAHKRQLVRASNTKMRASAKFRCEPCKFNFQSQWALDLHKTRAIHTKKTGETVVMDKISNKFRCDICDYAVAFEYHLKRHKKSSRHLERVKASS